MDDDLRPASIVAGGGAAGRAPDAHGIDGDPAVDDPTGRLSAYLARTQNALDILALCTLWIVIVPVADFGNSYDLREFGLGIRIGLSIVYGIDMTIRTTLARRHWHYLRSHPVGVVAVLLPPVRVLFSLRLIRALFRRGNIDRFLLAALLLFVNGALIVWLFERGAPGANITTLGASVWWSVVTVTTVGYGDYFPVTVQGRVVASFIMFIGIITVAVITAQVASNFVDQSTRRAAAAGAGTGSGEPRGADEEPAAPVVAPTPAVPAAPAAPVAVPVSLAELDARLSRIEQLLVSIQQTGAGEHGPGADPSS